MRCINCGGSMIGDGFSRVAHCEFVEDTYDYEPDAGPIYCTPDDVVEEYLTKWELVLCSDCNGSGEGMWDGSVCRTCKGKGEVAP